MKGIDGVVNPKLTQMWVEAEAVSKPNAESRFPLPKGRIAW